MHSTALIIGSARAHENVIRTTHKLIRKPNTKWAAHTLFDKMLHEANLTNIRNMAWYFATDIPSTYLRDSNSIFFFALIVAKK